MQKEQQYIVKDTNSAANITLPIINKDSKINYVRIRRNVDKTKIIINGMVLKPRKAFIIDFNPKVYIYYNKNHKIKLYIRYMYKKTKKGKIVRTKFRPSFLTNKKDYNSTKSYGIYKFDSNNT